MRFLGNNDNDDVDNDDDYDELQVDKDYGDSDDVGNNKDR